FRAEFSHLIRVLLGSIWVTDAVSYTMAHKQHVLLIQYLSSFTHRRSHFPSRAARPQPLPASSPRLRGRGAGGEGAFPKLSRATLAPQATKPSKFSPTTKHR